MKVFVVFKAVRLLLSVANWAHVSLQDGKITASETALLLRELASELGLPLELKITDGERK